MLDISKPLRRYKKLRDKEGSELQIDFAYERLSFFWRVCVYTRKRKFCFLLFRHIYVAMWKMVIRSGGVWVGMGKGRVGSDPKFFADLDSDPMAWV